ncbi:MAG TPA: phytanoyl-CoA dioxygenase family protein [Aggregatilineales bacterium]|nr:phytanoyl-CoA dioxygenase family protein [Aggregatilineales bacterium]
MAYTTLSDTDIEHFLSKGYVVVHECFSAEFAQSWIDLAYQRLGYDPDDAATWAEPIIHMPAMNRVVVRDFSPEAWGAICDLLGGEDRIKDPDTYTWGDSFIVNFKLGADRPWIAPSPDSGGWHKDGDFFFHFLDSPEQGLLLVIIWKDIEPRGGGTFVSCDSVPVVARFLNEHREGIHPFEGGMSALIHECTCFEELTGKVGDVVLLHPYMLHASSQNHSGTPRFMTNPPVTLKEPMNFNRENPADFSPLELAVLRGLGVERLAFEPTAPRREHVPPRIAKQRQMLEEEQARLKQS